MTEAFVSSALFGIALCLVPGTTRAQTAAFRPNSSVLFAAAPAHDVPLDTLKLPKTYWKEGALISGTMAGIWAFRYAYGNCDDGGTSCAFQSVLPTAFVFLIGAIPGALIGAMFDKPE